MLLLFLIFQQFLNSREKLKLVFVRGWETEGCAKAIVLVKALNQQNNPNPIANKTFSLMFLKAAFIMGSGNKYLRSPHYVPRYCAE